MTAIAETTTTFESPCYPIVYVRGFAPTGKSRDDNFHDLYYGYAETSVETRPKSPNQDPSDRVALDLFESQLIRFIKEYDYVDATHGGLSLASTRSKFRRGNLNPTRSIWISRFYDTDFLQGKVRSIDKHATDLWTLINTDMRQAFTDMGIDMTNFKVILIAHSMGGLVCRTLLQNILPAEGVDPKSIIHRLVTIASPNGGIDLGLIPDWFENYVTSTFNPAQTSRFNPDMIREYLKLSDNAPVNSLDGHFPPERCFCLIGSDYHSYDPLIQKITGNHSDGLVKQEKASIEGAYTANVHRAHSGVRGIVNSYESYENIQRFLFGDTKVVISLDDITIPGADLLDKNDFYTFEFRLSVRNTGVFLHERREDPCENAIRRKPDAVTQKLELHTAFLNSLLSEIGQLRFLLSFRVAEHRVDQILLWSREYPGRPIYSETLEVQVNSTSLQAWNDQATANPGADIPLPKDILQYHWLSEEQPATDADWPTATLDPVRGEFTIPLRDAPAFKGTLYLKPDMWNAPEP